MLKTFVLWVGVKMKRIKILWERYKLIKELKNRGFACTFNRLLPIRQRHGVSYDRGGVSIFMEIVDDRSQFAIAIIDFEIVERSGVFDYRTCVNRLTNTAMESIKFIEETLLVRELEML